MKRLSRRTLLRGASGLGLALPFLDVMRPAARAQAAAAPRRILFAFQANGDQPSTRFTSRDETGFELGEFLAPLEPYRQDLLFIDKLDRRFYELPEAERADNHEQGGSSLAPWTSGEGSFPIGGTDKEIGYVEGPSADYVIGERALAAEPTLSHRHLVYRVGDKNNDIWNLHAHAGPAGEQNPIPPETDPFAAYARLFSFSTDDAAAQALLKKRLAKRQSALDLVRSELGSLRGQVTAGDQKKLDQHAEALRDIERSFPNMDPANAGCTPAELGEKVDPYQHDNHARMGELFFKISTLAFACDLTRSINFNWSGNTSNRVYRNLGIDVGHHDISHLSEDTAFENIRKIHKHLWTENTKLYDLLKATPDGDGTLWDHTLVVHWNELGQGNSHSINDALVVLAGGAHQYFRSGRLVDCGNKTSFSDMLVTCFHYMGFDDVSEFGDPRLKLKGSLSDVTA